MADEFVLFDGGEMLSEFRKAVGNGQNVSGSASGGINIDEGAITAKIASAVQAAFSKVDITKYLLEGVDISSAVIQAASKLQEYISNTTSDTAAAWYKSAQAAQAYGASLQDIQNVMNSWNWGEFDVNYLYTRAASQVSNIGDHAVENYKTSLEVIRALNANGVDTKGVFTQLIGQDVTESASQIEYLEDEVKQYERLLERAKEVSGESDLSRIRDQTIKEVRAWVKDNGLEDLFRNMKINELVGSGDKLQTTMQVISNIKQTLLEKGVAVNGGSSGGSIIETLDNLAQKLESIVPKIESLSSQIEPVISKLYGSVDGGGDGGGPVSWFDAVFEKLTQISEASSGLATALPESVNAIRQFGESGASSLDQLLIRLREVRTAVSQLASGNMSGNGGGSSFVSIDDLYKQQVNALSRDVRTMIVNMGKAAAVGNSYFSKEARASFSSLMFGDTGIRDAIGGNYKKYNQTYNASKDEDISSMQSKLQVLLELRNQIIPIINEINGAISSGAINGVDPISVATDGYDAATAKLEQYIAAQEGAEKATQATQAVSVDAAQVSSSVAAQEASAATRTVEAAQQNTETIQQSAEAMQQALRSAFDPAIFSESLTSLRAEIEKVFDLSTIHPDVSSITSAFEQIKTSISELNQQISTMTDGISGIGKSLVIGGSSGGVQQVASVAEQLSKITAHGAMSDDELNSTVNALEKFGIADNVVKTVTEDMRDLNMEVNKISTSTAWRDLGEDKNGDPKGVANTIKVTIDGVRTLSDGMKQAITITREYQAGTKSMLSESIKDVTDYGKAQTDVIKLQEQWSDIVGSGKIGAAQTDLNSILASFEKLTDPGMTITDNVEALKSLFDVFSSDTASVNEKIEAYERFKSLLTSTKGEIKAVADAEQVQAKAEKAAAEAKQKSEAAWREQEKKQTIQFEQEKAKAEEAQRKAQQQEAERIAKEDAKIAADAAKSLDSAWNAVQSGSVDKTLSSLEKRYNSLDLSMADSAGRVKATQIGSEIDKIRDSYRELQAMPKDSNFFYAFKDMADQITQVGNAIDAARNKLGALSGNELKVWNGDESAANKIEETVKALEKLKEVQGVQGAKRSDEDARALDEYIMKLKEYQAIMELTRKGSDNEDKFAFSDAYKGYIETLEAANGKIKELQKADKDFVKQLESAQQKKDSNWLGAQLSDLEKQYEKLGNVSHEKMGDIQNDLGRLRELNTIINGLDKSDPKLVGYMNEAVQLAGRLKNEMSQVSNESVKFGDVFKQIGSILGNSAIAQIMHLSWSRVFMGMRKYITEAFNNAKEIESAMAQLQVVTGASGPQLDAFFDASAASAKELGVEVKDMLGSVEDFSRLGYSLDESLDLSKWATILGNIADMDVADATTGITSMVKGWGLNVSDAEHIADVVSVIGKNYAISSDEIVTAAEKSGAALNASGTSMEKSIALFAAANASVQNADVVGTALKTVSARITKSTEVLDELGESYDDLAEGMSKYRQEILDMSGVDIMVNDNTFKDVFEIFKELSHVWDDLSQTQQARISEILGGTRGLTVISSIMQNFDDAEAALADALNAVGTASNANDVVMETTQKKIEQLKASYQVLSRDFFNTDFFKNSIENLTSLIDGIDNLVNSIGGLPVALGALGGIELIRNLGKTFAHQGCESLAA